MLAGQLGAGLAGGCGDVRPTGTGPAEPLSPDQRSSVRGGLSRSRRSSTQRVPRGPHHLSKPRPHKDVRGFRTTERGADHWWTPAFEIP